jgi:hypothetical protein
MTDIGYTPPGLAQTNSHSANSRTEGEWIEAIEAAHQESVQGIIGCGQLLLVAKEELPRGTFETMIEEKLPFSARTAQRLMEVARDHRLLQSDTLCRLPSHWGTLHALTKLDDEEFQEKLEAGNVIEPPKGSIHPGMTRGDAKSKYDERDPDYIKAFISWALAGQKKIDAIEDDEEYENIPNGVVDAIEVLRKFADERKLALKRAGA